MRLITLNFKIITVLTSDSRVFLTFICGNVIGQLLEGLVGGEKQRERSLSVEDFIQSGKVDGFQRGRELRGLHQLEEVVATDGLENWYEIKSKQKTGSLRISKLMVEP